MTLKNAKIRFQIIDFSVPFFSYLYSFLLVSFVEYSKHHDSLLEEKLKKAFIKNKELESTLAAYQAHLSGVYSALANNPNGWEAHALLDLYHSEFQKNNSYCPLCGSPKKSKKQQIENGQISIIIS